MEISEVPPQYRRRRKRNCMGCNCDLNYARSPQGICKIIQVVLLGMAWIVIAASPYWRPIFVIGGVTWPFHVVMLLCILTWLAVLFMYCLFLSGYHLSQGHRNWPAVEMCFNVCMVFSVLLAAGIEAASIWRWDMRQGSMYTARAGSYSNYYQYGLRPGMSFTQTLNFNSYCAQRPYDCTDYFSLLAGNNSYYTNHIFAVVLLVFAAISFLVSTFFAYRTWRMFERDMYRPGHVPKPSIWMRFTYQMEQTANHIKEKANKVLKRDSGDGEVDGEGNGDVVLEENKIEKPPLDADSGFSGRNSRSNGSSKEKPALDVDESVFEERNPRSEGRESRARSHSSHHSSHTHRSHRSERRSKSRNSHRGHGEISEHSSRSSTDRRSSSKPKSPSHKVPLPSYEVASLSHPSPVGSFPFSSEKRSKKGKKENGAPLATSPVASVLI